jgi:hypothetical protein
MPMLWWQYVDERCREVDASWKHAPQCPTRCHKNVAPPPDVLCNKAHEPSRRAVCSVSSSPGLLISPAGSSLEEGLNWSATAAGPPCASQHAWRGSGGVPDPDTETRDTCTPPQPLPHRSRAPAAAQYTSSSPSSAALCGVSNKAVASWVVLRGQGAGEANAPFGPKPGNTL